jgi:hypothetical protein
MNLFLLFFLSQVFTHLFGSYSTLLLLVIFTMSCVIEFFCFLGIEYNEKVLEPFTGPTRVLISWFHVINTRNAGFTVINPGEMTPALQLICAACTYMAGYPVLITMWFAFDKEEEEEEEEHQQQLQQLMELKQQQQEQQLLQQQQQDDAAATTLAVTEEKEEEEKEEEEERRGKNGEGDDESFDEDGANGRTKGNMSKLAHSSLRLNQDVLSAMRQNSGLQRRPSNMEFHRLPTFDPAAPPPFRAISESTPASAAAGLARRATIGAPPPSFQWPIRSLSNAPVPPRSNSLMSSVFSGTGSTQEETKWDRFAREGSRVLSRDIITMVLALMVLALSENGRMAHGENCANIFGLIFELSSAFGTTGHSLGCPNSNLSLSGEFNAFSKLLIILCMLIGRHRGLPRSVDPAVYLPALLGQHGPPVARRATHRVHDDSASLSQEHSGEGLPVNGGLAPPSREHSARSQHRPSPSPHSVRSASSIRLEEAEEEEGLVLEVPVHGNSPSPSPSETLNTTEPLARPSSLRTPNSRPKVPKQVAVITDI